MLETGEFFKPTLNTEAKEYSEQCCQTLNCAIISVMISRGYSEQQKDPLCLKTPELAILILMLSRLIAPCLQTLVWRIIRKIFPETAVGRHGANSLESIRIKIASSGV